ncbi:MAG: PepSY domain-containing protein, partial [Bacteroidota bacterium]
VALFFLFASVTGILIHWRNLLTKFYSFIKEGKWKLIWTNAHTVLGVIGLPFQVMYAITGAFFGLLVLILLPAVFLKYDGDVEKVYGKIIPFYGVEVNEEAPASDNYTIIDLFKQVKADYPDHTFTRTQILNYGKEDALILFALDDAEEIHAAGSIVMNMKSGEVVEKYSQFPQKRTYSYAVVDYIFKLHFASFGGFFMKLVYFVMAMITAFMIISGVLLWREARNNNRYTYKQKLFHHRVTKAYLAICLGLFPAFGVLFLANKLVPWEMEGRAELVEQIFLLGWLLLTIMGLFWNKYSQQNRNYLIIGGVLSILIPIANGVMTGGWIWNMWGPYPWVAYVDMFWLFAGLTALLLSLFVLKVKDDSDKPKPPVEKVKPKEERLPVPEKIMTPNPLKELVLKFKSLRSTGA